MSSKRLILGSACIMIVWGVLHLENTSSKKSPFIAPLTNTELNLGITVLPDSLKDMLEIPDTIERKTNALVGSYEKISSSAEQMIESIQKMKAAANTFQEGKDKMLNDFKDLPTDLMEANMFELEDKNHK